MSGGTAMKNLADVLVAFVVLLASPLLTFVGRYRTSLPRVQRLTDKLGVQVRSTHYYEPTYADTDLPSIRSRNDPCRASI